MPIPDFEHNAPSSFGIRRVSGNSMLKFDPYNEEFMLIVAAENYKDRTVHYPGRVLANQIYRNRKNIKYCKDKSIRLSGPKF